jgi:catechol 2,3-dioxygenase-like lactoylglutathione lyase family enzyme
MVGLIAEDLERSHDFYGRLGLEFDVDAGTHREARAAQLTFFLDGQPSAWHPSFGDRPYPWLLEFFFESLSELRSKLDELIAAGYEPIDQPYDTGFGMWFAFVADPNGNTVLLSAQREAGDR